MYVDETIDIETEIFHEVLRTCVTIFLIFIILLIIAHIIVNRFKIKQLDDKYFVSKTDNCAYQFAVFTCVLSVAIILADVALLPVSILSNEIMLNYQNSYYMQWINTSLIQSLWNTVSFSSNVSIFILIPFATFFLDSEGFSGLRNNIQNRVMEAICFFCLFIFMILGFLWIIFIPFRDNSLKDLWQFYLPFIYSTISFIGVMLVCILSPLGCLNVLIKLSTELQILTAQRSDFFEDPMEKIVEINALNRQKMNADCTLFYDDININLVNARRNALDMKLSRTEYFRNLIFFLLLLILITSLVLLVLFYVVFNTIGIAIGLEALPKSRAEIDIGRQPSSKLGGFGAAIQILLILYLLFSSVWALYHGFSLCKLLPRKFSTDIQMLLKNCMCILLLTSANPIQCRLLGITTFNPLGAFGQFDWLDSRVLVLSYNIVFLALMFVCTFKKIFQNAIHKVVLVDSVREVITYLEASPKVVKALKINIVSKDELKTA